uniref:BTB domain-containing protein n=1 Tax=Oryza brachyantha TaxID=4533 RepID=J3LEC1_ORYBR
MAPAACRGSPSRFSSASAIVADTETGYHLLKIGAYTRTRATAPPASFLSSSQFTVGGYRWRIDYYPNGASADCADYISLFLLLDEKATNSSVKVQAQFQISSTDQVMKPPPLASTRVNRYCEGSWSCAHRKFIKREDFEKSSDLRDDSFTIRCDVAVIGKIRTEEVTTTTFVVVPPPELNQQLGGLLETGMGADVVFQVGDETFAAHRCVLAARSLVFSAELYSSMKEGDAAGVVRIEDMEAQVFKMLLRYVYTETLPEMEEDVMCQHLLVAAGRYNLERLKLICEEKLCRYIAVGTVGNILALADQHHCAGLKKACFHFLSSQANLSAVIAADGFEHLSRSCLLECITIYSNTAPLL